MSIQRFLSTRDAKAARRTLLVAQVTDVSVALLLALTGVAILGFYRAAAQSGGSVPVADDQMFPRFIMSEMPAGLAGLVVAAILSAALSSLSSGLNSSCAVIERDFLSGDAPERNDAGTVRRLRWLTWGIAVVAIGLSILNTLIEGNLVERCFKLVNLLTAPLFVLFFLALFVPWANAAGAWLGLLSSAATAIAIAYSNDLGLNLGLSFVWMMPCSLLVGITVGTLASALAALVLPNATDRTGGLS
jgi:SSS family solute:Na+ symporter